MGCEFEKYFRNNKANIQLYIIPSYSTASLILPYTYYPHVSEIAARYTMRWKRQYRLNNHTGPGGTIIYYLTINKYKNKKYYRSYKRSIYEVSGYWL